MLKLPNQLDAEAFLKRYWQQHPLFIPAALQRVRPAITRHELAWLATLEDVESQLVFVERGENHCRYRTQNGPFDPEYLQELPQHDWTLLVHDVEKHLPAMRTFFDLVPFIPKWRIDDLMVSFAAPGGGVGPHKDQYDVFLCQGIGIRNWRYTEQDIAADPSASDDLALLCEFSSDQCRDTSEGDILYLPPGTAHWGTATCASITYSIGMRAPQISDFCETLHDCSPDVSEFYSDTDLHSSEAKPGRISQRAVQRATQLLGLPSARDADVADALGMFATDCKDWLRPEGASEKEVELMLAKLRKGGRLRVHGMSQIAFDERKLYVNGSNTILPANAEAFLASLCVERTVSGPILQSGEQIDLLRWMILQGAFEIPAYL